MTDEKHDVNQVEEALSRTRSEQGEHPEQDWTPGEEGL